MSAIYFETVTARISEKHISILLVDRSQIVLLCLNNFLKLGTVGSNQFFPWTPNSTVANIWSR